MGEETARISEPEVSEKERRFGPFTSIVSLAAIIALFAVMFSVLY